MKKFIMVLSFIGVASSAQAQYYREPYPYDLATPVPSQNIVQQQYVRKQVNVYPEQYVEPTQNVIINKQYVRKQINIYNPAPVCTSYPDPYDAFGYLFGDPYMITVCQ